MHTHPSRLWLVAGALFLVGACGDDDTNLQYDAAPQQDAAGPACGNGHVELAEECDDGNLDPGDGCSATCTWEYSCGNGVRETVEECDLLDGLSTCVLLGFVGGDLQCTDDCQVNDASCLEESPDLSAWWPLDSTTGILADASGSGNGCSVVGGVQRGFPGMFGTGIYLDGLDAHADCGEGVDLDGMDALTLEAWVSLNAYSPEGVAIGRSETADASGIAYLLGFQGGTAWSANQYHAVFATHSLDDAVYSSSVFQTGAWRHVAGVYAAGTLILYLDGVEDARHTQAETGPIRTLASGRTHLGHLHDAPGDSPWDTFLEGVLDEVKIWHVARSQAEVCADAGGRADGLGGCAIELGH
jgi:cysteine-rich repeat protein